MDCHGQASAHQAMMHEEQQQMQVMFLTSYYAYEACSLVQVNTTREARCNYLRDLLQSSHESFFGVNGEPCIDSDKLNCILPIFLSKYPSYNLSPEDITPVTDSLLGKVDANAIITLLEEGEKPWMTEQSESDQIATSKHWFTVHLSRSHHVY